MTFLNELIRRPLAQIAPGLIPAGLYIGPGTLGLEVAVYNANTRPSAGALQGAWRARRGARAAPVLVVVLHGEKADTVGRMAVTGKDDFKRKVRSSMRHLQGNPEKIRSFYQIPSLKYAA